MKLRASIAVAIVSGIALTACGGSTSSTSSAPAIEKPAADATGDLKVWLMEGSQPQSVVDAVNAEFKKAYPNVKVDVQLQQWGGIGDKLTTSLGTDSTPDVVEIGNSLTSKFADAGQLADLSSKADDLGKASWLPGLAVTGEWDSKRYGVPYYGGVRIMVYNKEQFQQAGVTETPKTMADVEAAAAKLQAKFGTDPNYSAFFFPGKYWYGMLPFVWDNGGELATKDGDQWKAGIDSAESQKGLETLKNLVDKYSKAPKDGDETKNFDAFKTGKVGMIIDSWWMPGAADAKDSPVAGKVGAFPIPGNTAGKAAPVFFGGSDLAVSEKSKNKGLAAEWIKILTSKEIQTSLAKDGGVIPNQEAAFVGHEGNEFLKVADEAAKTAKFTPITPTWANVEAKQTLPDMLTKILSGKASVADATKEAAAAITAELNG